MLLSDRHAWDLEFAPGSIAEDKPGLTHRIQRQHVTDDHSQTIDRLAHVSHAGHQIDIPPRRHADSAIRNCCKRAGDKVAGKASWLPVGRLSTNCSYTQVRLTRSEFKRKMIQIMNSLTGCIQLRRFTIGDTNPCTILF